MKIKHIFLSVQIASSGFIFTACDNYLDEVPEASISPEVYFTEATHIQASADNLYSDILPSHGTGNTYGIYKDDATTDNQIEVTAPNRFTSTLWKVDNAETSNWNFDKIYKINFVLSNVLPNFGDKNADGNDLSGNANTINGDLNSIKHYIGELFFLRACEYFKRYQLFGDFPIITHPLLDDKEALSEASKRSPRNEVARFILSDLDKAITLLKAKNMPTTRINADAAILLKSRVALFEGTWLKYFKDTPFVPNGPEWPGKSKEYNANYQYPTGDIDKEIDFFLTEAMNAAKEVADATQLVENTGTIQQAISEPANPYMDMFGDEDMSDYSEVLLWRPYSKALGLTHGVATAAQHGNYGIGVTRGMVNGFLMANGLPVYAAGSGYQGDETISDVRKGRDSRLHIFLKEPGQINVLFESAEGDMAVPIEPFPVILNNNAEKGYSTGYALRKGNNYDQKYLGNGLCYTGALIFRGTEALLNYIEACYEKNGSLDNIAQSYWTQIRKRSHVDTDYNKTIAATDMAKEALNDWGAYSAGKLIDPTLYNIRRERRCELMAEGLRYMDLMRWRAMDQMISTPYHIEGFKLWGSMQHWYDNEDGTSQLVYGMDNPKANVSDPAISPYLRPYEKNNNNLAKDGYRWAMAHYLEPYRIQDMDITSGGGSIENSPIYQNPYWPTEPNMPPLK